jgi:hypothetical protein
LTAPYTRLSPRKSQAISKGLIFGRFDYSLGPCLRTSTNILPLTAVIVVPTVCYCSLVQSCATLGSTERSHHRATQLVITLVVTLSSRSTSPHFDKHSCSLDSRVSFLKMVFPHLSCGCSTRVFLVSFVFRMLSALHALPGCSTRSTEHANTSQDIFYATRFTQRRCRIIRSHHLNAMTNSFALDNIPTSRYTTIAHPHGVNMPTCLESALSKKTRTPLNSNYLRTSVPR